MSIVTCENRIMRAVENTRNQIADMLASGKVTLTQVENTRKAMDMSLQEYCKFQELKSLAVAQGKLSLEEGQTVYRYLGEPPSVFNEQDCAVKTTLTNLFAELLEKGRAWLEVC